MLIVCNIFDRILDNYELVHNKKCVGNYPPRPPVYAAVQCNVSNTTMYAVNCSIMSLLSTYIQGYVKTTTILAVACGTAIILPPCMQCYAIIIITTLYAVLCNNNHPVCSVMQS